MRGQAVSNYCKPTQHGVFHMDDDSFIYDENYESGPFCHHMDDAAFCDEECNCCGHPCHMHDFPDASGSMRCLKDSCSCSAFVDLFSTGTVIRNKSPYDGERTYTIKSVDRKNSFYIMDCGFHMQIKNVHAYYAEVDDSEKQ